MAVSEQVGKTAGHYFVQTLASAVCLLNLVLVIAQFCPWIGVRVLRVAAQAEGLLF